jgi:uncharacterized membrane protein
VLGIVGFVLMLVAIKNISDVVADRSIFNNMLVAVGLAIAGIVTVTLVVVGSVLRFVGMNAFNFGPDFNPATVPAGDWIGLIGSVVLGLCAVWVMMLISAIYVRRSYRSISHKLGVNMFKTAGLMYLIGAATTILLVGFLLLFVAQILVVAAFLSIEEKPAIPVGQPLQPVAVNLRGSRV